MDRSRRRAGEACRRGVTRKLTDTPRRTTGTSCWAAPAGVFVNTTTPQSHPTNRRHYPSRLDRYVDQPVSWPDAPEEPTGSAREPQAHRLGMNATKRLARLVTRQLPTGAWSRRCGTSVPEVPIAPWSRCPGAVPPGHHADARGKIKNSGRSSGSTPLTVACSRVATTEI